MALLIAIRHPDCNPLAAAQVYLKIAANGGAGSQEFRALPLATAVSTPELWGAPPPPPPPPSGGDEPLSLLTPAAAEAGGDVESAPASSAHLSLYALSAEAARATYFVSQSNLEHSSPAAIARKAGLASEMQSSALTSVTAIIAPLHALLLLPFGLLLHAASPQVPFWLPSTLALLGGVVVLILLQLVVRGHLSRATLPWMATEETLWIPSGCVNPAPKGDVIRIRTGLLPYLDKCDRMIAHISASYLHRLEVRRTPRAPFPSTP